MPGCWNCCEDIPRIVGLRNMSWPCPLCDLRCCSPSCAKHHCAFTREPGTIQFITPAAVKRRDNKLARLQGPKQFADTAYKTCCICGQCTIPANFQRAICHACSINL